MNGFEKFPIVIYGLFDPEDDELMYIGKTIHTLEDRLRGHMRDTLKGRNRPVNVWIRELLEYDEEPIIKPLLYTRDWFDEHRLIVQWLSFGADLLNRMARKPY